MSKSKFVKDYVMAGERVNEIFLLTQKQLCVSKNAKEYLSLKLADKTGEIDGKKWETTESEFDSLIEGCFYVVKGMITEFNGLQLRIDSISRTSEECKPEDFKKSSPKDLDEMKSELKKFIVSIKDENCKKLLAHFFNNPSFYSKFIGAPAAAFLHHDYVGGLLEHTLETSKLGDKIASVYECINRDILITGCILHDIGKIREYEYKAAIDFSVEGHLMGHIFIGASMVEEACKELNLNSMFTSHIIHMILSHHGELEWGSPKKPCSLEALVLHQVDDMSFKVTHFMNAVREDQSSDLITKSKDYFFNTKLFKGYANEFLQKQIEENEHKAIVDDFLIAFGQK